MFLVWFSQAAERRVLMKWNFILQAMMRIFNNNVTANKRFMESRQEETAI